MSFTALTKSKYRSPRSYRLGGYALSFEAATPWASRIKDYNFIPDEDYPTVVMTLSSEMKKKHGILFRMVGEVENFRFMFVTQVERFKGYRNMPSSEIPQFTPCEKDEAILKILEEEGITQYEYQTVLD